MADKPPKVLWVTEIVNRGPFRDPLWRVAITTHQANKLPDWVKENFQFFIWPENRRHAFVRIPARDEIEAMMRFNKLWVGLPKE